MSNIDPTVPVAGNPTTDSVRANFATAKAEIESLQAQQNGEISIFGQMTAQQITDFRAGTFSFDVGLVLQAVATYAAGLIGVADNDNGIIVRVPAGKGQIQTQIVMPAKTNLICDGVLLNGIANSATPPIIFSPGAHCDRLLLDCNSKTGVIFGSAGVSGNSRVGKVRLQNVDRVAGIGVRFLGYLWTFDTIRVDGGLVGVDFGDGAGTEARQINGRQIYAFNNVTGVRFFKASSCSVARLIADSSNVSGVQIDQSHDISLPNTLCFWNDGVAGTKFTGSSINVGSNSIADPVTGLILLARCNNTSSTYCATFSYVQKSRIQLEGLNSTIPTGNANPSGTVANFTTGYDSSNFSQIHYDSGIGHAGALNNSTLLETGGFNSVWNGSFQAIGGIIAGATGTPILAESIPTISADVSLTTQIVPQPCGINQAVNAGEVWLAYLDLDFAAALATTGLQIQLTGPAMTASFWSAAVTPDVITAGNHSYVGALAAPASIAVFTAAQSVGVGSCRVRVRAYFQPSANGTINLAFAQNTSSATAITLKAGSTARFRRIS